MSSNPLAGVIAGDLSAEQTRRVVEELEVLVCQRAAGSCAARLTVPVHIALGTK